MLDRVTTAKIFGLLALLLGEPLPEALSVSTAISCFLRPRIGTRQLVKMVSLRYLIAEAIKRKLN